MRNLLILFLIFSSLDSVGQNDGIQNEILNYSDSKSELIVKGRRLLLDKFLVGDYEKVRELKDYLKWAVENQDYVAFYPIEYWLILHWTQEYTELIDHVVGFDTPEIAQFKRKMIPPYDLLFEKIRHQSRVSELQLQAAIYKSNMEDVEKDFLSMHLKYILADTDYPQITQDSINAVADAFLSAYPKSKYEDYTRKFFRQKMVVSNWGFGFEFFSGYGILSGNLDNKFRTQVPFGVAFDIEYKRAVLYLRDYIGISKTREDIPYSRGIWERGSQVRVFLPEASLGYVALNSPRLKIAPFAGIASTDIGPTQVDLTNNPDLKEVELEFTTTYTLGINVDIKLGRSKMPIVTLGAEENYLFLRLRYAYNLPQFERSYAGMDGHMHYLTVGLGGFGRKIKRDY